MGSYLTPQNMTALGGGLGAIGSIQQGVAASKADKYNAQVAQQNAALATQNAALEGAIGEANVGLAGLKTQQQVGAIKATQAGRGVDVNTGSAKAVQTSQAETGMLDAANIRSNAARQAYGFEVQATGFENDANLDKANAGKDMTAGVMNAGTALTKAGGEISEYNGGDGPTSGDTTKSESLLGGTPSTPMNLTEGLFNSGDNEFIGYIPQ